MTEPLSKTHFDLIVVGGGMVGATFAIAAQKALSPVSILIVEAAEFSAAQKSSPSFDDRSTALSHGSSTMLDNIGLWKELQATANKIETIHVSDKGHIGITRLNCDDYHVDALGYVVPNKEFGKVINHALIENDEIHTLAPATVESIKPTQQGVELKTKQGEAEHSLTGSLLILAEGGRSPLCGQLGISRKEEPYGQHALITNVEFSQQHLNKAFERFTDTGPLAVLPLKPLHNRNLASLVWTISESQAKEFAQYTEDELKFRLQERFGDRLGEVLKLGTIVSYPLILTTASEQIRPGIVLLGNAAHTLHPVAGQGFNLSMRDVFSLVDTLAQAKKAGQPFGEMSVLQRYLNCQSDDQQQAILATDTLTKLFSSNSVSKSLIRKLGLLSLEISPALKQSFAKRAMGAAS